MIDLTPLDVRKKKDDFRRSVRGYDQSQVDSFLETCADRLDELVLTKRRQEDEIAALQERLRSFEKRERALNEALVAAQELREEARVQARKSAELKLREATQEAEDIRREAEFATQASQQTLDGLRVRRAGFLRSTRWSLERFLGEIEEEERQLATEEAVATTESEGLQG